MRRHQISRMVVKAGVKVIAAWGLNPDKDVAQLHARDGQRPVGDHRELRSRWFSPLRCHRTLHRLRQTLPKMLISSRSQGLGNGSPGITLRIIRLSERQLLHQHFTIRRHCISQVIPRRLQGAQDIDTACRRIKTDTISEATITVGIVCQHKGQPLRCHRRLPEL